uniref:Delta-like protein n=1 Tax=Strongyloides papillosus TaxID=174720 RepID=A0A0N5C4Q6_STREA
MEVECINGYEKNYNGNILCNEYGEWINEEGKIIDSIKCIKRINQNDCKLIGDCRNNGTCIYEDGFLKCQCKENFYGPNCQFEYCDESKSKGCLGKKTFRQYTELCGNNPCLNNSNCKLINNNKNYYCKCGKNLIDKNCGKEYDVCKIVGEGKGYCNGHGRCIIRNKKPFCECMFLWKGKHCEESVDICERNNNYCLNGGRCLSSIGSSYPACKCQKMYQGSRCEEKIDYCQFKPCFHGGYCKRNEVNGYECSCTSSYMGKSCHINRDICSNNPCQNSGICVSQNETSYTCICSNQYTGPNCSQFINLCLEYEKKGIKYCLNDGVCHSLRGENILCECRDGYSGDKCQDKINKNEKNYNLFFTPTKFYDFDYYSQYNKSSELSNTDSIQQLIFSQIFRSSFLNETTICGWIKPSENEGKDTSFIIIGTYDGNSIKKTIIDFKLTGVSLNYKNKVIINYKLIRDQWQHICLRSPKLHKYKSTSWDFFYNGVLLKSADKGIEPLKIKEKYLRVLLGITLDLKIKYQGEMSLVEYYSNLLSDEEIFNLSTKCSYTGSRPPIVSWLDFSDSTKTNGFVVKIEPGLCSDNNDDLKNNTLNILRDETSYTSTNISNTVEIKNCPKDIYKYTDDDGAIVEWEPNKGYEIFKDYLKLKNVYVNFESGGYFKL